MFKIKDGFSALLAAILPAQEAPTAPSKPQALPGYRKSQTVTATPLKKSDMRVATLDRLSDIKTKATTSQALSDASKYSGELSSAVSSLLRTGIPETYRILGRTPDGKFSSEITQAAHELIIRLTFGGAVDGSFGDQNTLQTISETLALDMLFVGAACVEVALDAQLVPASLNVVAASTLVYREEQNSFSLVQRIGGKDTPLDLATIIYVPVDQRSTELFPSAPFEAAIQSVILDIDFNNDVRRALKRAVLPRLQAKVDLEALRQMAPPDVLLDSDKWLAYQSEVFEDIRATIEKMGPEDVLVSDTTLNYSYIDGGHDPSDIIERVQQVINAKLTSGVKALPVSLGFGGSANSASAEAMLYVKQADMLRRKLQEVYSRALSIAVRLLGYDGYVEFIYDTINLRPEDELEAFKAMEQSRILDLYSLGFLGRDETAVLLTGHLPPETAPDLSGTLFRSGSAQTPQNPTSNTSAMGQALKTGTPTAPKTSK